MNMEATYSFETLVDYEPIRASYIIKNMALPLFLQSPPKCTKRNILSPVMAYIFKELHASLTAFWSSGQSFWPQTQRPRVRFPKIPDFMRSGGSGTGSPQHREDN
jgi:hypothetical protein